MPDPLKSGEIEDVLSSIRRLVADEVSVRGGVSVSDATSTLRTAEKLLLTSALRVAQPVGAQSDREQDDAAQADDARADDARADDAQGDDAQGDDAQADDVQGDDARADDAQGDASQGDVVTSEVAAHDVTPADVARNEPDTGADPASEAEVGQAGDTFSTLSKLAKNDRPDPAVDAWEEVSLETRIADLESAVANSDDDWEPDGSEIEQTPVDLGFATVIPDAEPAVDDPAEQAAESAAQTDDPTDDPARCGADPANMFDGDPDILDEEMLRQLVTDIVREELQGSLGERITRNVRKLVRREINNALAARDFD